VCFRQSTSFSSLTQDERIGFTDEEFAKLKEAQANSDALVTTETIAMNAMKGLYDDGTGKYVKQTLPDGTERAADVAMAQRIMHDEKYHADKHKIVRPIDEFFVLLEDRTNSAVEALKVKTTLYGNLMIGLILMSMALLLVGVLLVVRKVIRPVSELDDATHAITEGKFTTRVAVRSADELGVVALSFNTMVETLQGTQQRLEHEKQSAQQAEREAQRLAREAEAQRNSLAKSVQQMLEAMNRFKAGDLTVHLHGESRDEIGRLYEGFNEAVSGIRHLVSRVLESAAAAASAATQISAATEQMAASAEEQAAQVSSIVGSVDQLSDGAKSSTTSVQQTAMVATENGKSAKQAVEVTQQSLKKMGDIGHIVEQSATTVQRLGDSSAEIGEIVQVIEEIADQTNLLALNAAIEAARAGEQGRGFAVVADEVRKLAERTAQATKQISATIRQIQQETAEAVSGIQRGNDEVREGMMLADQAGKSLEGILNGTRQIEQMIRQLLGISEQQSSASVVIQQNTDGMSSAVHQNAATVREISNTAADLSRLTEHLLHQISRFSVSEHTSSSPSLPQAERLQLR